MFFTVQCLLLLPQLPWSLGESYSEVSFYVESFISKWSLFSAFPLPSPPFTHDMKKEQSGAILLSVSFSYRSTQHKKFCRFGLLRYLNLVSKSR